tara:strand:+ start:455 stop:829 length:375 start_codon:yes stop_codon:yes gene_type:complete
MAFKMKGDPMKRNFGISPIKFFHRKKKKDDEGLSDFEKEFKKARAADKKTFTFNNKLYTTETKEEKEAREAKAKIDVIDYNKLREQKPHRFYGLSDARIKQIVEGEKRRTARKAKFKPGTSDPR